MSARKDAKPSPVPAKKRAPKRAADSTGSTAPAEAPSADAIGASPIVLDDFIEEPVESVDPGSPERIVVFSIEGQRYAFPIDVVQEIQQIVEISGLPDTSAAILGVINVRGRVVPVVDLRALVGLEPLVQGLQTPMVFTRTAQGIVALVVDEVEDVLEVPAGSMQAPSSVHALSDRLLSVCSLESGMVFVFDVDALIPPSLSTAGRS